MCLLTRNRRTRPVGSSNRSGGRFDWQPPMASSTCRHVPSPGDLAARGVALGHGVVERHHGPQGRAERSVVVPHCAQGRTRVKIISNSVLVSVHPRPAQVRVTARRSSAETRDSRHRSGRPAGRPNGRSAAVRVGSDQASTMTPLVPGPVWVNSTMPSGVSTVRPREVPLLMEVVSACR